MTILVALHIVTSTLAECASACGKLGADGGVRGDPVCERILAVLDDGLASLITIVRGAGLARCDGGIVDQLEKVLSITCNDSELLAVLAESIELVSVRCLELLAGNVGELGLCNKGLGLCTNKLLLEDNNLWRVWLLVLELRDLVGDLLLACRM